MDEFIDEWLSNPDFWFNADSSIDQYLTEKYGELLGAPLKNKQHAIILYDQLPRHMYRNQCANHIILYYLDKALDLLDQINPDTIYDAATWCFVVLPFRHRGDIQDIFSILEKAWMRLEEESEEYTRKLLTRFIKATYERVPPQTKQLALCEIYCPIPHS